MQCANNNTNEGANKRLRIQSSGHNRVLVAFDLSNISTTNLVSATLVLNGFRGTGAGVTWNCAQDADISNQRADCATHWNGGSFAAATAPGVLHTRGWWVR